MEAERTPRNSRDALIADLLGDLGRVDDKITALEQRIDSLPDAFKEAIAPSLGAVTMATKEAQAAIQQAGRTEVAAFKNFTAQDKIALRDALKAALREDAGAALADVARDLSSSARLHEEAAKAERRQRWQWLAVALAVGLLGGALGLYGSHLLYGQQQAEQAAFGRAVMATWGDLDAKAKERIQEARRNTP
ncbi:hypothetical protein [Aeromonas caviae]|uniref:hypothetical protein n=1 Tax=Aeromonas caviae TaxID=648 RepID=UPI001CC7146F|nr:hypothetical protein [Aeromonas caviae]GJA21163.1 hypothetical protein KAM336_41840 [Aeromonas caviae]GJA30209.1 hypothetical protein KAM340_43760 [Aeromonas caviae]